MVLGSVLPESPIIDVILVVVATGVIWLGSGWLEASAERLSTYYGLPAVVQGSVVVAVGSSFPELASVVVAGLAGASDLGVGAIVGSAVFNVLVIPALSGLFSDADLEASRTIVYKEAQFYMIAVSAVIITFALAVIYVPIPGAGRRWTGGSRGPSRRSRSCCTGSICSSSGRTSATTEPKGSRIKKRSRSAGSGRNSLPAWYSYW